MDVCRSVEPPEFTTADTTRVFCHLHTDGPQLSGTTVLELATKTT
jgi:hypothetical protein